MASPPGRLSTRALKKWTTLCPAVARSLEEAGLDLLTFYGFPPAMWKSLRATNALENLNREFRRRTKTEAVFTTEAAAVTVLFGLVALGHVVLRKIDGHTALAAFLAKQWAQAARCSRVVVTPSAGRYAGSTFYQLRDGSGADVG